jgi:hypothetical protein
MAADRRGKARDAVAWIRLPGAVGVVVAGSIERQEALVIFDCGQIECIRREWRRACDEAASSEVNRAFLRRRQFLDDRAFGGYAGGTPSGLGEA